MATVRLTPDVLTEAGVTPVNNSGLSTANTYQFRNNGKTFLRVANGGASSCTVTLTAQKTVGSHTISNETVVVAAAAEAYIGPLSKDVYNDVNGDAYFTLSYVTSVTVAIEQMA